MPNHVDNNNAAERVRRLAQKPLDRLWGGGTDVAWSAIEGHDVWRVRRVETSETAVVKVCANVAMARAMVPSGVAARVLEADDESGLCVLEDLGDTTLADILADADPDAASMGLLGLASSLGDLHGWSRSIASSHVQPPVPPLPLAAFFNVCGALGVDAGPARSELIEAERCMLSEEPQVVLHGDVCPDNYVPVTSTHPVGKFVDFEGCRRGNAILEVACWHMPFPTCWRVARLPVDLTSRMDASYLAALASRRETFGNDAFQRLLAAASIYWVVWCLTGKRFIETNDEQFAGEGFASVRQRGLLWLANAGTAITAAGEFEAAGDVVFEVARRLRQRWEPSGDAPTYPAFLPQD